MMKIGIMRSKKNATYVEKSFVISFVKKQLYKKVRDHCHFTEKFRAAAHSICNLHYKVPRKIPVNIHNGSKYD